MDYGCFRNCRNLENVTLSNKLKVIPAAAFADCTAITNIDLPIDLEVIGAYAFKGCTNLQEVVIPPKVNEIYDHTFSSCSSLKRVEISGVYKIWFNAFSYCRELTTIISYDNLQIICGDSFEGCDNLETSLDSANIIFSHDLNELGKKIQEFSEKENYGIALAQVNLGICFPGKIRSDSDEVAKRILDTGLNMVAGKFGLPKNAKPLDNRKIQERIVEYFISLNTPDGRCIIIVVASPKTIYHSDGRFIDLGFPDDKLSPDSEPTTVLDKVIIECNGYVLPREFILGYYETFPLSHYHNGFVLNKNHYSLIDQDDRDKFFDQFAYKSEVAPYIEQTITMPENKLQ